MSSLDSLLSSMQRAQTTLHLDTTDLCYLIALRLRADRAAMASFTEDTLYDVYEQVEQAIVRKELERALRGLEGLGFVDLLEEGRVRLRAPLLRFAEPVRDLDAPAEALADMVSRSYGEADNDDIEPDDDGDRDESDDDGNDDNDDTEQA